MPMAFELLLQNTATLLHLPLITEDDRMALVLCTLSEIHGLFKPRAVLHTQQRKLCFTRRRCVMRQHLFYMQLLLMWSIGRQSSRRRTRAVGMESRRRPFSFDLSWLWMMHPGAMLLSYCSLSILLRVSVSNSLTTTSSHLSTRQDGCVIRFGIVPTLRGLKHHAHYYRHDHSGNESLLLLGGFID